MLFKSYVAKLAAFIIKKMETFMATAPSVVLPSRIPRPAPQHAKGPSSVVLRDRSPAHELLQPCQAVWLINYMKALCQGLKTHAFSEEQQEIALQWLKATLENPTHEGRIKNLESRVVTLKLGPKSLQEWP